jgi:hypothetical protein
VAELTLLHLGVPRTINPAPVVMLAARDAAPVEAPIVTVAAREEAGIDQRDVMPDVRGLSGREAVRRLARLGIAASIDGVGLVVEQDPEPGVRLDLVGASQLRLGRPGGPASSGPGQH